MFVNMHATPQHPMYALLSSLVDIIVQSQRSTFVNISTKELNRYTNSEGSYVNYSNTTKNNILFIDVSASRRKPSSGLTSGAGRQYVKACPIYVAQLVAPLVSIHVVGLPGPYRLPYESVSFA